MNVALLNPNEVKELFYNWGQFSQVCYDTPSGHEEQVGKGCMFSGHFSGSRANYIKFLVTDVPRFTIDQVVRAEVGAAKNVGSFRYVNKDNFCYEIPTEIKDNQKLVDKYISHMNNTMVLYSDIQQYVLSKGKTHERANEQARYVLPMSTHSSFVIGFTIEALIHFMHIRLCVRAEDVIQQLAKLMKQEVISVLPDIEKRLVPNCEYLMWCPEGKKSCGAYPTKKQLKETLSDIKK